MHYTRSLPVALAILLGVTASACGSDSDLSAAIDEANRQITTVASADTDPPVSTTVGDSDPVEPNALGEPVPAAFTEAVADQAAQQDSFRFSMSMSMSMTDGPEDLDISPDAPLATGEVGAGRSHVAMDLGVMMKDVMSLGGDAGADALGMLDGMDLTMETITDANSFYLRAPLFAEIARMDPTASAGVEPLVELGDGWGRVDYSAIPGVDLDRLLSQAGGMSPSDPEAFRGMLAGLTGDTYKVEDTTIDGVEVTHYSAMIRLADTTGLDSPGSLTGAGVDAMTAKMLEAEIPLDFYVDAENNLRRIAYEMDLTELVPAMGGFGFGLAMSMDYFDYGADIHIETPSESVDLTQWALSAS